MATTVFLPEKHKENTPYTTSKGRLKSRQTLAKQLLSKEPFKSLKFVRSRKLIYHYTDNYYQLIPEESVENLVFTTLSEHVEVAPPVLKSLVESMSIINYLEPQEATHNSRFIRFRNGMLDLNEDRLKPHNPEIFSTSILDFEYKPYSSCPLFMKYINHLCDGDQDKLFFLRCWLKLLVKGFAFNRVFLYVMGRGGTGKSVFANVATLLTGKGNVLSISFRGLNYDQFETTNLINKKLVLINDTERYGGSLEILKQMTGGDSIKARMKSIQGSFDFIYEGMVLITGNTAFESADTSGAIERRMKLFIADNPVEESQRALNLINWEKDQWKGDFVTEFPGIFNWVYNAPELEVCQKEVNAAKLDNSSLTTLNPIRAWIEQALVEVGEKEGSFIGYKLKDKGLIESGRRGVLYPHYLDWCERNDFPPTSIRYFADELVAQIPWKQVKKSRRKEGIFIYGVKLNFKALSTDSLLGAPIEFSQGENPNVNKIGDITYYHKEEVKVDEDLYKQYMSLLGKSRTKDIYNDLYRKHPLKLKPIAERYFANHPRFTQEFRFQIENTLAKGLETVRQWNPIQWTYVPLGGSPRIQPKSYGMSLNSCKVVIREGVYQHLANLMPERTILDLDLVSCYVSILIGLYPSQMSDLQQAIEGPGGMWNSMKKEFERKGVLEEYVKAFVKICVYSSFFGGRKKAMVEGIMDSYRKDTGYSVLGWRDPDIRDMVDTYRDRANSLAGIVEDTSFIHDFRKISGIVKESYLGDRMVGPTGHNYFITEENFFNNFPNFLQSYEFYLLARAYLRVAKEFPNALLIGHFHDGNVVSIPNEEADAFYEAYNRHIQEVGFSLANLKYKQSLELKHKFVAQPLERTDYWDLSQRGTTLSKPRLVTKHNFKI